MKKLLWLNLLCTAITNMTIRPAELTPQQELNSRLFYHTRLGNFEQIKLATEQGANINAVNDGGDSWLMTAIAEADSPEIVKFILEQPSINVNYTNRGNTALNTAISYMTSDHHAPLLASLLILAGATIPTHHKKLSILQKNPMTQFAINLKNNLNQPDRSKQPNIYEKTLYNVFDKIYPTGIFAKDIEREETFITDLLATNDLDVIIAIELGLMLANSRNFLINHFEDIYNEYKTLSGKTT